MSNLYGELLYNEELYTGTGYAGSWSNSYSFDYLKGTTVVVKVTPTWTVPQGTTAHIMVGEDQNDMMAIQPGVATPVLFINSTTGPTNLYVRIDFVANIYGTSPTVDKLVILIQQTSSLFTVATQVFTDGLDGSGSEYYIDPWTQNVIIPYSWFKPITHRKALGIIAESCGGAVYQDRQGVVRLESALFNGNGGTVDIIGQDRIIDSNTPVSEVFNRVQINTKPYIALAEQDVWALGGDNAIESGQSRTFRVFFNDWDAVIDAYAVLSSSPAGATITSETWYTWGGNITVLGSAAGQLLTLSARGKPLAVRGARLITEDDSGSVRRNGLRALAINDNQLIQDPVIAETVAEAILSSTAQERRDIEAQWRGDPTIELGDKVEIDGQHGIVLSQQIRYDGALSSQIKVRRI
jgi:hypothetical protein